MTGIWARSTLTAQCNYGVNSSNKDKTLLTCCKFLCRPKILAHAGLDGQFNFDKTLLALVGTKALVFLDPAKRNTCHKCMVCPLSKKHYRNYCFFIPETKGYQTSASEKFFPVHCKMPAIEPGDTVRLAAQNPITAMQKLSNAPIDLNPKHMDALRKLTEIFNEAACVDDENTENNPAPRVKQPLTRVQPSSSHDPTSPKVLTVMM